MKGLRVSAAAESDLDDIWYYVAVNSGSLERANKFVDTITQRLSILTHTPKARTVRADIDVDVRGLLVGDYIVYYRETKKHVIIARVIHGSRDQEAAY